MSCVEVVRSARFEEEVGKPALIRPGREEEGVLGPCWGMPRELPAEEAEGVDGEEVSGAEMCWEEGGGVPEADLDGRRRCDGRPGRDEPVEVRAWKDCCRATNDHQTS